jgi:N6-adenosine-specific RNA methylase IME4
MHRCGMFSSIALSYQSRFISAATADNAAFLLHEDFMIQINPDFQKLIPPLSAEEKNQLESNLVADGCRDPLVLWGDTLIDGHNRFEICTRLNIPFQTISKEFDSENAVKLWMIRNQKGRRNINEAWDFKLAQTAKEILLEMGRAKKVEDGKAAREKQLSGGVLSTMDKTPKETKPEPKHNTRDEIAKELGWGAGKVARADVVFKEAAKNPELEEKVLSGEVSINEAYKEIKAEKKIEQRKTDIEQQKKDIEESNFKQPDGLFDVIAIDPPWAYGREYDPETSRVANPYPEMPQSELLKIELPVKDDAVLFLWTTHAFIFDAKELMDKWGFTYKACMVWNKEKIGMGSWLRMQCEFCLVGIKGKPYWNNTTYRDIITSPRREHSRKPDEFFDMVANITAGRRLEYFSREKRDGWEIFGNDTNKF